MLLVFYCCSLAAQDLDRLGATLAETATLRDWDVAGEGKEKVVELNGNIFKAVPEIKIEVLKIHESTNSAVCEIEVHLNNEAKEVGSFLLHENVHNFHVVVHKEENVEVGVEVGGKSAPGPKGGGCDRVRRRGSHHGRASVQGINKSGNVAAIRRRQERGPVGAANMVSQRGPRDRCEDGIILVS